MSDKTVVGLVEKIKIDGKEFTARVDTGADRSSIDKGLALRLNLGPVIRTVRIKSANGMVRRPIVWVKIRIKNRIIKCKFNVADRSHMRYRILLGLNVLKRGFLIDTSK